MSESNLGKDENTPDKMSMNEGVNQDSIQTVAAVDNSTNEEAAELDNGEYEVLDEDYVDGGVEELDESMLEGLDVVDAWDDADEAASPAADEVTSPTTDAAALPTGRKTEKEDSRQKRGSSREKKTRREVDKRRGGLARGKDRGDSDTESEKKRIEKRLRMINEKRIKEGRPPVPLPFDRGDKPTVDRARRSPPPSRNKSEASAAAARRKVSPSSTRKEVLTRSSHRDSTLKETKRKAPPGSSRWEPSPARRKASPPFFKATRRGTLATSAAAYEEDLVPPGTEDEHRPRRRPVTRLEDPPQKSYSSQYPLENAPLPLTRNKEGTQLSLLSSNRERELEAQRSRPSYHTAGGGSNDLLSRRLSPPFRVVRHLPSPLFERRSVSPFRSIPRHQPPTAPLPQPPSHHRLKNSVRSPPPGTKRRRRASRSPSPVSRKYSATARPPATRYRSRSPDARKSSFPSRPSPPGDRRPPFWVEIQRKLAAEQMQQQQQFGYQPLQQPALAVPAPPQQVRAPLWEEQQRSSAVCLDTSTIQEVLSLQRQSRVVRVAAKPEQTAGIHHHKLTNSSRRRSLEASPVEVQPQPLLQVTLPSASQQWMQHRTPYSLDRRQPPQSTAHSGTHPQQIKVVSPTRRQSKQSPTGPLRPASWRSSSSGRARTVRRRSRSRGRDRVVSNPRRTLPSRQSSRMFSQKSR